MNKPTVISQWRGKLLFGLAALIALVGIFVLSTYSDGHVSDVVIHVRPSPDGQFFIHSKDLEDRINAGPTGSLMGSAVDKLPLATLETILLEDPFVRSAEVYVDYGGVVHADITQNQPIARLHHRSSSDYYLDEQGHILPLSRHAVARVPVISGAIPAFATALQDSSVQDIFRLVSTIRGDELLHPLVDQIDVSTDRGYVLVPKVGTATITVGNIDDLTQKLKRLTYLYYGALPRVGWEMYSDIDLRFSGQVVCKKQARGV